MVNETMSKTQKLTLSAMIIALYVVVVYITQSISFGAYQIRMATSLYALSYLFPFLVLPLGLANCLSNVLGGLGVFDIVGGFFVGILTAGANAGIRKLHLHRFLVAVPIILIPGLGVAIWLSCLLGISYPLMALNLIVGQLIPGVCGAVLIEILRRVTGTPGRKKK